MESKFSISFKTFGFLKLVVFANLFQHFLTSGLEIILRWELHVLLVFDVRHCDSWPKKEISSIFRTGSWFSPED